MPEPSSFKCLRCGHEWRGVFDADAERMCPKCRSNSVRRIKDAGDKGTKEQRDKPNK